jgi:hypothetical protein
MAPPKKAVKAAKHPKSKGKKPAKARPRTPAPDVAQAEPALFDPLTPGEAADALRTMAEDRRLTGMAKVGRYRVICTEPLVVKPPHWMAGHRLARVVAFDYANDRSVDVCVDLDAGVVAHLELGKGQPMLSREEEAIATSIAINDPHVREKLGINDEPLITMHYWGRTPGDLAYERRSAAVMFGRTGGQASVIAVVDLLEQTVTQVVPAEQW